MNQSESNGSEQAEAALRRLAQDCERREARKAFFGFGSEIAGKLTELAPFSNEIAEDLVEGLYKHILSFAGPAKFLSEPGLIERLRRIQKEYFLTLTGGDYEEEYFHSRLRIGLSHQYVQLPAAWYLGAYCWYACHILEKLKDRSEGIPPEFAESLEAFLRVVFLDISLAMDAYITTRDSLIEEKNIELKEALNQLDAYSKTLEKQVAERTRELECRVVELQEANRTIQDTRDELVRTERLAAIGTLAAGLAHEVRNPLNSAAIQLTLLQRQFQKAASADLGRSQDICGIIRKELDRLERLVRSFLDFARPSQISKTKTLVSEFVDGIVSLIRPMVYKNGIQLHFNDQSGKSYARLDVDKMHQAILNLVNNAIEATDDGGELSLDVSVKDSVLQVRISDTGVGIPAKELDHVFEIFHSTKAAGTGLGLPIAQRVVHMHGGTLKIESEHQVGTTCVIRLPTS